MRIDGVGDFISSIRNDPGARPERPLPNPSSLAPWQVENLRMESARILNILLRKGTLSPAGVNYVRNALAAVARASARQLLQFLVVEVGIDPDRIRQVLNQRSV